MSWRLYKESDQEAVLALHAKMEERIGRKMDLPDLLSEPVICAVVREEHGVIAHCIFLEAEVEACAIGEKPLSPMDLKEAVAQYLLPIAKHYKLRIVRAFVPATLLIGRRNGRPGPIPRILKKIGFKQENDTLVQFYRWLVDEKTSS